MKVSIIIPVYNVEPYIGDCLRSVISQRYQGEIECLVIDDGSSDHSMDVAERIIAGYDGPIVFKTIRHQENCGLSAARNTGIAAATGDYLYFLDSDDEIADDCVKMLAEPLQDEHYDIVVGDLDIKGNKTSFDGLMLQLNDMTVLRGKEIIDTYRDQWNMIAVNKLYRVDFLKNNHLWFENHLIHEDELWSFQVACHASSLCAVKKKTYIYKMRQGSIMDVSKNEKRAESYIYIVKEMCRLVNEKGLHYVSTHHLIQVFFYTTLSFYANDPLKRARAYKELRSYTKMSVKNRLKGNSFSLKGNLLDLHYYMPSNIGSFLVGLSLKLL